MSLMVTPHISNDLNYSSL